MSRQLACTPKEALVSNPSPPMAELDRIEREEAERAYRAFIDRCNRITDREIEDSEWWRRIVDRARETDHG